MHLPLTRSALEFMRNQRPPTTKLLKSIKSHTEVKDAETSSKTSELEDELSE